MAMLVALLSSLGAGGAATNARTALERPASDERRVDEALARVAAPVRRAGAADAA
jgi:hypothetical protein